MLLKLFGSSNLDASVFFFNQGQVVIRKTRHFIQKKTNFDFTKLFTNVMMLRHIHLKLF